MPFGKTEAQVFATQKVVTDNGFESVLPANLNPLMKDRASEVLGAKKIVNALAANNERPVVVPMFKPTALAAPEIVMPVEPASVDPHATANEAAVTSAQLMRHFIDAEAAA